MKINKVQIHQEKVSTYISEEELTELIIKHVCEKSNFRLCPGTLKKVYFNKKDRGIDGFKTEVSIELINEILPLMEKEGNPLPVEY